MTALDAHATEAEFQAAVVDLAHLTGWTVAHFRPGRTEAGWRTPVAAGGAGFPDLVLVRERVIFAELKSQRGRIRPEQRAWLDRLAAAGAECYILRPADWPDIERVLKTRVPA